MDAEGKSFSSGVDIGDHKPGKSDEMNVFYQIFKTMFEIEKPIICAVDGYALGGGCELAICSDIVVASDRAKFGQPEIRVGAIATLAVYMLPRLLSWPKAMELLLSGEHISSERAEKIGLINAVLPSVDFAEEVDSYIQKYLKNSPLLLRKVKKALMVSKNKEFEEAIVDVRKIVNEEILTSHDGIEGLNAFLEKRKPVWLGK
ncbi:cyclohexa-1,5-dienecarbonyl-CoA hydratase [Neobacillus niacini]|nr:cyclohexa-1,5-dienecarbonyl-CoA hydratase [Neobacillus niacini]